MDPESPAKKTKSSRARPQRKNQEKQFDCPECSMKFSFASNLHRHLKNIHKKVETCMIEGCNIKCSNKRLMRQHVELEHAPNSEKVDLEFASLEEFYAWKLREEVQNFVCFTKRRGDIQLLSSTHQHYICFLSRRVAAKEKLAKMDLFCPARMLLKQSKKNGAVRVSYYKTHSHRLAYSVSQHLPVPDCLRHDIKEKLKAGMTVDEIYWQLKQEHQSQLAISVAMFNRLQKVGKTQIGMIQRSLIKRGVLPTDSKIHCKGAEEAETQPRVVEGSFGEGELVNDGEVEMDMEAADGMSETVVLHVTSFSTDLCRENGESSEHKSNKLQNMSGGTFAQTTRPVATPVMMDNFFKPMSTNEPKEKTSHEDADRKSKLKDLLRQVLFLVENEDVKSALLPYVEGGKLLK